MYALLAEMVDLLEDPYTRFLSPADLGDPAAVDPTYVGIGALVDSSASADDSEGLRILYVFQGASARDAGIEARDRIIAVDGDPCARIADIRGPAGTSVTLTVVSPGEEARDVVVERRKIDPLTLPESERLGADQEVGYLRIPGLSGQEVIDAVDEELTGFLDADTPIDQLILDLRSTNIGAPGVIVELLRHFVSGEVGPSTRASATSPSRSSRAPCSRILAIPWRCSSTRPARPRPNSSPRSSRTRAARRSSASRPRARRTRRTPRTCPMAPSSRSSRSGSSSRMARPWKASGVTPDIEVDEDWLDFPEAEDPGILAAVDYLATAEPPVIVVPSPAPSTSASEAPDASASPGAPGPQETPTYR